MLHSVSVLDPSYHISWLLAMLLAKQNRLGYSELSR